MKLRMRLFFCLLGHLSASLPSESCFPLEPTGHAVRLDFRVWDLSRAANEASVSQALIQCLGDGGQAVVGPGTSDGTSAALPVSHAFGAASPGNFPRTPETRRVRARRCVVAAASSLFQRLTN